MMHLDIVSRDCRVAALNLHYRGLMYCVVRCACRSAFVNQSGAVEIQNSSEQVSNIVDESEI